MYSMNMLCQHNNSICIFVNVFKIKTVYHCLGKFSKQQTDNIFSYSFPGNRLWRLMQMDTVYYGDNLMKSQSLFPGENYMFQSVVCRKFSQHAKY